MANTALTADIVAKAALAVLENELGWLNRIYRAHEDEFSKEVNGYRVGETISIRRPDDGAVRTGATATATDVIEGKVTLTVNNQVGTDFSFTSADLTLKIEDLTERVIKPRMANIVNHIAADVATVAYKGFYNWAGTAGQTINSFADFAKGPERLDEMAVPQDDRIALLSPADHWALVGAQTALYNGGMVSESFRKGLLGEIGGCSAYMSQVVPTHTTGSRTNSTPLTDGNSQQVTYDTAKNTWSQTLITDGWASSLTLTAGDVFTIDGVFMVNPKTKTSTGILQQFVVNTAVTANETTTVDTTISISPPIIVTGPHQTVTFSGNFDGRTITNVGTASTAYKQNMVFHKNSIALAVVPMVLPPGAYGASRTSYKGFSCRVIPVYDGTTDVSMWRLDMLYGRACIDPRLGTRLSGTA